MINLFMDDLRMPLPGFVLARSAEECLEIMRKNVGNIRYLTLDHDLGEGVMDGYDFVKRMVDEGLYAEKIYIHSANPTGRANMYHYLVNAVKHGVIPERVEVHNGPIPFNHDDYNGVY